MSEAAFTTLVVAEDGTSRYLVVEGDLRDSGIMDRIMTPFRDEMGDGGPGAKAYLAKVIRSLSAYADRAYSLDSADGFVWPISGFVLIVDFRLWRSWTVGTSKLTHGDVKEIAKTLLAYPRVEQCLVNIWDDNGGVHRLDTQERFVEHEMAGEERLASQEPVAAEAAEQ